MRIPATCLTCNFIFPSAFNLSGRFTIRGCTTNCPRCGSLAQVWDGVFDAAENILNIVQMSAFTQEQIDSFLTQSRLALSGQISLEQLEERSRKIDPNLGKAAEEIRKSGPVMTFLLLLFIFAFESCNVNIDINRLIDQFMANEDPRASATQSQTSEQPQHEHSGYGANPASYRTDPEAPGIPHPKPPRQ